MKTKYGSSLLRGASKAMGEILEEQRAIMKELSTLKKTDFGEGRARELFIKSVANREEYEQLQSGINHMVYLETFFEDPKPSPKRVMNPKARR